MNEYMRMAKSVLRREPNSIMEALYHLGKTPADAKVIFNEIARHEIAELKLFTPIQEIDRTGKSDSTQKKLDKTKLSDQINAAIERRARDLSRIYALHVQAQKNTKK